MASKAVRFKEDISGRILGSHILLYGKNRHLKKEGKSLCNRILHLKLKKNNGLKLNVSTLISSARFARTRFKYYLGVPRLLPVEHSAFHSFIQTLLLSLKPSMPPWPYAEQGKFPLPPPRNFLSKILITNHLTV